jgi:D-glycero-alpha-D-manno-heptose 1-phosphate guanylyltransferase
MKFREALILAGGIGSRLKTVVPDRPKPMAEINGRPFIEYVLDDLIEKGVQRVILSVGYKHESILLHFGKSYRNLELVYAIESQPLGTGGGVANALRYASSDLLFVINGDTYFPVSLVEMEEKFLKTHADILIALCQVSHAGRYGSIYTDEKGRILLFREKQEESGIALINGGIYLMKRDLLEKYAFPDSFSFEKDFLEKYTGKLRIFGMISYERFIDIGVPESYELAKSYFRNQS